MTWPGIRWATAYGVVLGPEWTRMSTTRLASDSAAWTQHKFVWREAGPGPSYLDDGRGARNHWTTRNTVFAAWNMLHAARRIVDQGGIPAYGNISTNWDLSDPDDPTHGHP